MSKDTHSAWWAGYQGEEVTAEDENRARPHCEVCGEVVITEGVAVWGDLPPYEFMYDLCVDHFYDVAMRDGDTEARAEFEVVKASIGRVHANRYGREGWKEPKEPQFSDWLVNDARARHAMSKRGGHK